MNTKTPRSFLLLAFIVSLAWLAGSTAARAQTDDSGWVPPINLSKSGGTSNPVAVRDSQDRIHAIWTDELSGYMYALNEGGEWTSPAPINLPFNPEITLGLQMLVDDTGRVHAYWIEDDNDLFYSQVDEDFFDNRLRWRSAVRLDTDVLAVASDVDPLGALHTAYVSTREGLPSPSGVYYRRSTNGGFTWSQSQMLYETPYFRNLTLERAHVSIESGSQAEETSWVQAAWDNQPRERVLTARSVDGGLNWEMAEIVDGPVEDPDSALPYNITLGTNGDTVLMVWESGIPGDRCRHYSRYSTDGGTTWSEAEPMLLNLSGCANNIRFHPLTPDRTVMAFRHRTTPYLMAWEGTDWGQALLQDTLAMLEDPETLNQVILGCLQNELVGETLITVACDENLGKDIWASSRDLGSGIEWFPPEPTWSGAFTLTQGDADIQNPVLTFDTQGRAHVFWEQALDEVGEDDTLAIYYARREMGIWSTARVILRSPEGDARGHSVALDEDNRLHVVWSEGEAGPLYYSWANASLAVTATEWEVPRELPVPRPLVSSPEIYIDEAGIFYVLYALRLNEGRGVYLIRSTDGGVSWTEPEQVVDAEAAGWEMLDFPHLAKTDGGVFHSIWTQQTLPGGAGPLAIYYSRSSEPSEGWSRPDQVVEQPVLWSALEESNQQIVHRIWQQSVFDRAAFRHQFSVDRGLVWSTPATVSGLEELGPAGIDSDTGGALHLAQVTEEEAGINILRHWRWDGAEWMSEEALELDAGLVRGVRAIGVAASPTGRLAVVMVGRTSPQADGSVERTLLFTDRALDLPAAEPTPLPTPTSQPELTATPEDPGAPAPTPTISLSGDELGGGGQPSLLSQLDIWAGPVIGVTAAGLIIFTAVIVGARRRR